MPTSPAEFALLEPYVPSPLEEKRAAIYRRVMPLLSAELADLGAEQRAVVINGICKRLQMGDFK